MPSREDVARQFDRRARAYLESATHAKGSDLEIVARLIEPSPQQRLLDVATGGGHTAVRLAPHVSYVVALDLVPAMVRQAVGLAVSRGCTNVTGVVGDACRLPLGDRSFDSLTCRVAPHHFLDPAAFVREVARVLRQGGTFVLEDSASPDDPALDRFLHLLETTRDPTHVRSLTVAGWLEAIERAGMLPVHWEIYRKEHDLEDWIATADPPPAAREEVRRLVEQASPEAVRHFAIAREGERTVRITDDKLILKARNR